MADLAAPATESTSQAAPGSLLRGAAETASQDPSKVQTVSQPGNPIRALQANPIESTIPSTTPRMLNVVPAQSPSVDYSGVHSMLSSLPVPPPHVAASLIRAIMTPPSSGGVVAPRTPAASMPSTSVSAPGPSSSGPSIVRPVQPPAPSATMSPAPSGGGNNSSVVRPQPSPAPSYRSAPSGSITPSTHQNVFGGNPFIGGGVTTSPVEEAANLLERGLMGVINMGEGGFFAMPNPLYNQNQSLLWNVQNSPLARALGAIGNLFHF